MLLYTPNKRVDSAKWNTLSEVIRIRINTGINAASILLASHCLDAASLDLFGYLVPIGSTPSATTKQGTNEGWKISHHVRRIREFAVPRCRSRCIPASAKCKKSQGFQVRSLQMRSTQDILGSRVPTSPNSEPTEGSRRRAVGICVFACVGLFSIGYEQGVLPIAMGVDSFLNDFCVDYKGMSHEECSASSSSVPQAWLDFAYWVDTMSIVGYIVGALLGALLADFVGRRWTIVAGSLLFAATSLWVTLSSGADHDSLLAGRTFQGIGGGMYVLVLPIYCVEVVAKEFRGLLAGVAQLLLAGGYLAGHHAMVEYHESDWQVVYFKCIIPASVLALGGFLLPETPRWVHLHKGKELAEIALKRVRNTWLVQHELDAIATQTSEIGDAPGWQTLANLSIVQRIAVVAGLQLFQMLFSYTVSTSFASLVAISRPDGFYRSIFGDVAPVFFIVETVCALPALSIVEHIGRRRLLLVGALGMSIGHLITGISVVSDCDSELFGRACSRGSAVGILVGTSVLMLSNMVCWTPVIWLYPAEIFPINVRAKATGVASVLSGVSVFWVRELFPEIVALSLVSFLVCMLALLLVFALCLETKRVLLEDTEELFPYGFPSKRHRNSLSTRTARTSAAAMTDVAVESLPVQSA